jgi:hypothetical protein
VNINCYIEVDLAEVGPDEIGDHLGMTMSPGIPRLNPLRQDREVF